MQVRSTKLLLHNASGELLLLKRSQYDVHRPGTYDLPGGGVEMGETPLDTIVREAQEEIGLSKAEYDLECYFDRSYHSVKQNRRTTRRFFVARIVAGAALTLSHEHSTHDWFNPLIATAVIGHFTQQEAIEYVHFPEHSIPLQLAEEHSLVR